MDIKFCGVLIIICIIVRWYVQKSSTVMVENTTEKYEEMPNPSGIGY